MKSSSSRFSPSCPNVGGGGGGFGSSESIQTSCPSLGCTKGFPSAILLAFHSLRTRTCDITARLSSPVYGTKHCCPSISFPCCRCSLSRKKAVSMTPCLLKMISTTSRIQSSCCSARPASRTATPLRAIRVRASHVSATSCLRPALVYILGDIRFRKPLTRPGRGSFSTAVQVSCWSASISASCCLAASSPVGC
ncbi:hypothetical protein D3C80_1377550 [compost metagenome]